MILLTTLLTILIYILVLYLVYWVVIYILSMLEAAPQIIKIAKVILLIVGLLVILSLFFGGSYVDLPRVNIR